MGGAGAAVMGGDLGHAGPRVALLMGQEDPESWGSCSCLLTRAPATSWVEAVPTRPTKYCLDPRRGHSRWGRLPWRGHEMRRTGSEGGSWAVGDKGTVPQGAQAACHPRRWPHYTPVSVSATLASRRRRSHTTSWPRLQARPHLHRMRQQGSSVPPALWVLGCLTLFLWLWVLCTSCNRKQARRQLSRLQGSAMPAEVSLLRRPHHCSLSKSDTRLHELHRSRPCSRAPRPASMDLLCPQWLEASRDMTRAPAPFSHQELPLAAPSTGPEATYSNVGLATIPRARLAVSFGVWAGARLTSSYARPGPEARPVVAEYACVQKLRGTDRGPQGLGQGKVEATPPTQVDILYSRVNKPKRRDPGPATDQPDPKGGGAVLALGSDPAYEVLPLGGLGMDKSLLENVYESIQEMGAPLEPPSSISYQERTCAGHRDTLLPV